MIIPVVFFLKSEQYKNLNEIYLNMYFKFENQPILIKKNPFSVILIDAIHCQSRFFNHNKKSEENKKQTKCIHIVLHSCTHVTDNNN